MESYICQRCKNYVGDLKCFAFPERIPDIILKGENMHNEPLEGQEFNIVFEENDQGNAVRTI